MNVYITEHVDKIIDGYQMIPIIYGKIDLSVVPNNAATRIVAVDAMDSIPYNLIPEFLNQVRVKMRMGCELILGGMELSILSKDILNGKINSETFNNMVFKKRAIYSVNDLSNMLTSLGLNINNIVFKGHNYEVAAIRPQVAN
jgi:hypothetical protein